MISEKPTQYSLKLQNLGLLELKSGNPIPTPRDDEILVRVRYVALNPVDAKSIDLSPVAGATIGCDFAGEVVQVGKSVKKNLHPGDRICSSTFGNNPDNLNNGAFAEYAAVPGDLVLKIPDSMSYQAASTLPLGLATVGLAFYQSMKLPIPPAQAAEPEYILIHGAGTATGTLAVQAAKWSGYIPIATCSPRSSDRVQKLGAAAVFDYASPTCGSDIRTYTNDSIRYALDCITNSGSMKICYAAISSKGGQYVGLDPIPVRAHTRRSVKASWIIAFTVLDMPVNWKRPFKRDAKPEHRRLTEQWFLAAQDYLNNGSLKPHAYEERDGGLKYVADGLDELRKGSVSGIKLVYKVMNKVDIPQKRRGSLTGPDLALEW